MYLYNRSLFHYLAFKKKTLSFVITHVNLENGVLNETSQA